MWEITVAGEATGVFDAMLQAIAPGYIVNIGHRDYSGYAEWVGVEGRCIVVKTYNTDSMAYNEAPTEFDWARLDKIHVYWRGMNRHRHCSLRTSGRSHIPASLSQPTDHQPKEWEHAGNNRPQGPRMLLTERNQP